MEQGTLTLKARFWLLDKPDRVFSGSLSYSAGIITLDLVQPLVLSNHERHPFSTGGFGVIHGETIENEQITLFDCYSTSVSIEENEQKHTEFSSTLGFLGIYCDRREDLQFNSISVEYSLALPFVNFNPYQIRYSRSGFVLKCFDQRRPAIQLSEDLSVKFTQLIDPILPIRVPPEIRQRVRQLTTFHFTSKLSFLGEIQSLLARFSTVLELAAIRPSRIRAVACELDGQAKNITVLSHDFLGFTNSDIPREFEFYFELEDIVSALPGIWSQWTAQAPLYNFAKSFLEAAMAPEMDFQRKFHILIPALDTLDNGLNGGRLSFGKRIGRLLHKLDPFTYFFLGRREDFIRDVVNTRKYLFHGKSSDKEKSLSGWPLYHLTNYLETVCHGLTLRLSGFPDEVLRKTLVRRRDRQLMQGDY